MKKGRKWTQAEKDRMRAVMLAKHGKKLVPVVDVLARKKRDVRSIDTAGNFVFSGGAGGSSGGSANASTTYASANQVLAIDVVRLIGHDVPADVIVKVVERIMRP